MAQPADVTRSVLQGEGEEGKEKPSSPLQQPLSCFPKPGPGAAGRADLGLILASGVHTCISSQQETRFPLQNSKEGNFSHLVVSLRWPDSLRRTPQF